jgi:hypothetical protein
MRADVRALALPVLAALLPVSHASAQRGSISAPVLRARALRNGAPVKMFVPSGTVQIIGWDRDSLVIRGRLPASTQLLLGGSDTTGYKLTMDARDDALPAPVQLAVYLPRRSQLALKTADATTEVRDVGGWFYTVSGRYWFAGTMSSLDAEAMSGDLDLEATTPWARARTGRGHLVIGGAPDDVDASTIGGALDVEASSIRRGRFTSVTGDIHYAAAMREGSLFELSTHSGAIELLLPRDVSAHLDLSSLEGEIDDGFVKLHPANRGGHSLQLRLGTASAEVTVRTFKGTVRVRARQ